METMLFLNEMSLLAGYSAIESRLFQDGIKGIPRRNHAYSLKGSKEFQNGITGIPERNQGYSWL